MLSHLLVTACLLSSVFGATQWDCDFEDGFCEFTTGGQDNAKWVRNTGETETIDTGPVSAQEGSYYVYTPAAGNSYRQFYLNLPLSRGFSGFGINFYYHMYGEYVGYLKVEASTDGGATYETAWQRDLKQQTASGSPWFFATFHFEDVINNTAAEEINSMRFVGYGFNAQSDIAIDNFVVIPLPSASPTPVPTQPSQVPTPLPTAQPTHVPSPLPTIRPTPAPAMPSIIPSPIPTDSEPPTFPPTPLPTPQPTPSPYPSLIPTPRPTAQPSLIPTRIPTLDPTPYPTLTPSLLPTTQPTKSRRPTPSPSWPPSLQPSPAPTTKPTDSPTLVPTSMPSLPPTSAPSPVPSIVPTAQPTHAPTRLPTPRPTPLPTYHPTPVPSFNPTDVPTDVPTSLPTLVPSQPPTPVPTEPPTMSPIWPTPFPTPLPTPKPTAPLAVSSAAVLTAVIAFFGFLLCGVVSLRLWRWYRAYAARKRSEAALMRQEKLKAAAVAKAEQLQKEAEAKQAAIDKLEAEARAEREAILAAQLRVDVGDVLATATKIWPRSDLEVGSERGFIDSGHESKEGFSDEEIFATTSAGRNGGVGGTSAPSPEPPLEAGAKVVVLEVCRGPDTRPLLLRVKRFDDGFGTPAPDGAASAARRASAKELEAKRRDSSSRSRFRQSFTASKAPPPPSEFWVPALDMAMSHPDDYPPGMAFKTAAQVREVQAAAAEAQAAEAALARAMAANNGNGGVSGTAASAGATPGNSSSSRSSNASSSRTRLKRYKAPIASRQGQWPVFDDGDGNHNSGTIGADGSTAAVGGGSSISRTRTGGGGLGSLGGGSSSTRSRARLQRPNIANISRDVKNILQPPAVQAEHSSASSHQDLPQLQGDDQGNYVQSSTGLEKGAVIGEAIPEVDEDAENEADLGDGQEEEDAAAAGVETFSNREEGGSQWRVSEKQTEARLQELLQPSSPHSTQKDASATGTAAVRSPLLADSSTEATTPTVNKSAPPLPARAKHSPPPPLPSRPTPTSGTDPPQLSPTSSSRPQPSMDGDTVQPPPPPPSAAPVEETVNIDEKEGEAFLFRAGLAHCTASFQRDGIGTISSLRRLAAEPTDKLMVLLLAKLKMKPADAKTLKTALAAAARDEWPEAQAMRFEASRARYDAVNVASNPGTTL